MQNNYLPQIFTIMVEVVLLLFACIGAIQCISVPSNQTSSCLILTPYILNGSISTARNLSEVSPKDFHGLKSYSGFITVKKEYDSNLFFWFFPVPEGEVKDKPWIIWLQGGPGISSLMGLFDLIGPLKLEDGKVKLRNVTWASDYSLVFLDNPVGAGFSFTSDDRGYPSNEDDVGAQMYEFLKQFLHMFPELRTAPLFVTGESYAGKHVPALSIQIHRNMNTNPINMKGLAIGNGLIDPRSMMHYGELCRVLGLLDNEHLVRVKVLEETVVNLIDQKAMVDAALKFNETIEYINKHSGISMYNFEKDAEIEHSPEFETFINRPDVRQMIHAGNAKFDFNNQLVYKKLLPDIMNTTKPWLEELLEHYGVMSYSGQLDVISAYSLSKYTYDLLQWSKRDEYVHAPRKRLRRFASGEIVAYKKCGGNFADVLIRRGGHRVALKEPEVIKFILDSFIEQFK